MRQIQIILVSVLAIALIGCGQDFKALEFNETDLSSTVPVPSPTPVSLACGNIPHGGSESRTRYQSGNVPFGSTCQYEIQVRTCNNGILSSWSGSFTFATCSVLPAPTPTPTPAPLSCGAIPHGGSESRTRYQSGSVPFGSTCQSEIQTRTCNNGILSVWSGTYTFTSCNVLPPPTPAPTPTPTPAPLSCGSVPHGGSESRIRYQAGSVPFGSTCQSEVQTRTCSNGTLSAWSGTYTFTSCSILPAPTPTPTPAPLSCGAIPHGGSESRIRYQAGSVPFGSTCQSEVQTRTCDNGTLSVWSGTYTFTSCSVLPAPTPTPTPTPVPTPTPTPVPSPTPVTSQYIHFPAGSCPTGVLEVQLNSLPHPQFPQINSGDCFRENVNSATTTLRVRCIDPSGQSLPSDWVGPATSSTLTRSVCARLLN